MSKISVAVVGASGYSGEELLRLLFRHNFCEVKVVTSRQYVDRPLGDVFPRFAGAKLRFSAPDVKQISAMCNVAFLALPHGLAAEFAKPLIEAGLKVIDISADFRIKNTVKYKEYYKEEHPAPDLLSKAVYGLPERYRDLIKDADLIACPGCYPTSIILPSAPLLKAGLVSKDGIIASSMSGVSGAGRKVELAYTFPECNESVRAYSPVGHRHLPEIEQELAAAAGIPEICMNFIPHLVPVNRGINSTLIFNPVSGCTLEDIAKVYEEAYANETFVRVLSPGKMPDTKNVTMTNICEIGFTLDKHTGKLIVASAIDNLTKGASGQAIQCMNIRFGLEEAESLL